MKLITTFLFVFCAIFSAQNSLAQLPEKTFGMNAAFSTEGLTQAQIFYTPNTNIQLEFGAGIVNNEVEIQIGTKDSIYSNTQLALSLSGKYLFNTNAVSPFIGASATYYEGFNMDYSLSANFGAQGFISKNIALFAMVGLGYSEETESVAKNVSRKFSIISFTGAAAGISFYF